MKETLPAQPEQLTEPAVTEMERSVGRQFIDKSVAFSKWTMWLTFNGLTSLVFAVTKAYAGLTWFAKKLEAGKLDLGKGGGGHGKSHGGDHGGDHGGGGHGKSHGGGHH